jgi:hypothetical protein
MEDLTGTRLVAEEQREEDVALVYDLLESGGFHPILAWVDDGGRPHTVNREAIVTRAAGLLPQVVTPFAVYVPEDEGDEAEQLLRDAGRAAIRNEPSAS